MTWPGSSYGSVIGMHLIVLLIFPTLQTTTLLPLRQFDIDLPAATRETITCQACLQTTYGRRQTRQHSLVWGECMRAPRPLLDSEQEVIDENGFLQEPAHEHVDPELRPDLVDQEDLPGHQQEYPPAVAGAATAGTSEGHPFDVPDALQAKASSGGHPFDAPDEDLESCFESVLRTTRILSPV